MKTLATVMCGALLVLASGRAAAEEAAGPEVFRGGRSGEVAAAPWWAGFDDERLTAAVEEALGGNFDIAAGLARLRSADAQVSLAASPLMPSLTLDGTLGGQPANSMLFQMGGLSSSAYGGTGGSDVAVASSQDDEEPDVSLNVSGTINLRYQFDLWGRQLLTYRASQMLRAATAGDVDAAAMLLTIQVGGAYFDAVMAVEQIEVVNRQIELNTSLLELLQLRYENDQARAAEVLQQRQQLAAARARLPGARAALRVAQQRLGVLLGRQQAAGATVATAAELPEPPAQPPTGRPADLLENRPDLRAARARLEAAQRRHASARRSGLPTLGVSGQVGAQGIYRSEYAQQTVWGFGVTVSVPIFRGLSEVSTMRDTRAQADAARHTLSQNRLQAVSDVEAALAAETEAREQLAAHRTMLEAAQQAFDVARDSYTAGVGNYLTILAALGSLQAAELTVLQSERALIGARLQLHLALGGAWTDGLARAEGGDR